MFTLVMMTALSGSPDAVQFGGRSKGCDGGGSGFLGGLFNRGGRMRHKDDACCAPATASCCGHAVAIPAVPSCCGHGGTAAPVTYQHGATPLTAPAAAPAAMPGTAPATPVPATPMPDKPVTPAPTGTAPPVTPGSGF